VSVSAAQFFFGGQSSSSSSSLSSSVAAGADKTVEAALPREKPEGSAQSVASTPCCENEHDDEDDNDSH
jgi:hypothetical protein